VSGLGDALRVEPYEQDRRRPVDGLDASPPSTFFGPAIELPQLMDGSCWTFKLAPTGVKQGVGTALKDALAGMQSADWLALKDAAAPLAVDMQSKAGLALKEGAPGGMMSMDVLTLNDALAGVLHVGAHILKDALAGVLQVGAQTTLGAAEAPPVVVRLIRTGAVAAVVQVSAGPVAAAPPVFRVIRTGAMVAVVKATAGLVAAAAIAPLAPKRACMALIMASDGSNDEKAMAAARQSLWPSQSLCQCK